MAPNSNAADCVCSEAVLLAIKAIESTFSGPTSIDLYLNFLSLLFPTLTNHSVKWNTIVDN